MNKLKQAARQALEALECWDKAGYVPFIFARERAIIALREALAEQAEQEPLMITPGGGAFPIIEVDYVGEFAEPIRSSVVPLDWSATFTPVQQEPVSTDWTPPNYTDEQWQKLDQEYQDHVAEQAEQEPVACYPCEIVTADFGENTVTVEMMVDHYQVSAGTKYLCDAAPVRTKDLTDDEIVEALGYDKSYRLKRWVLDDARAVIAADREKNK